jgi:hypothetical protein
VKQKEFLFVILILLTVTGFTNPAPARSAEMRAEQGKLGVKVDATWVSKYLWHGFPVFGDQPAFRPGINLDLYGTGFSINILGAFGDPGKVETYQEIDYTVAYDCNTFADTNYATDIKINYIFYDFKEWGIDKQEVGAGFIWPKICPAGIVPGYYIGSMWPRTHYGTGHNYLQSDAGGFIHVFSLSYDLTVPEFLTETGERIVHLTSDLTYNDGYGARYGGPTADHDWSHATFGASTDIAIGALIFKPAVYYQISMDKSVNDENELVTSLGLSYRF